ncbi:MAG: tRNA (adenosine(37)-N6)-dimethylallyltransferase MiaA [Hamadaea sp.]|uniref:tRNA (adenosine(37)-N6)-dimethylallyltransferase MiaA n=1 Tax=Hamadaea sp. TaxID=2024425 RepID=UPI0017D6349E|nr:tRNA (adenosine(37)-N6)-dimethylallyltransferase MiaA [Hamadaea sp.]NUT19727.1 tRNA (adenosine(37)-N6)-dimethylallyltransferase MiaA [Hamadaea sp.]
MRVIAIVGPTAAGKSALSIELAHLLDAEVINCDSMQFYRGMDIGTAKLSPAEREGVPHHLLDIWPVTETASVAVFQDLARDAIAQVAARGRTPMLVGGTGLYLRAVLEEFEFPGTDPDVRARLEAELAAVGPLPLHRRLADRDPAAAAKILPSNGRRIVRALEVIEITGRPFTAALPDPTPRYASLQLAVDRADLDQRTEQRVRAMWQNGLVDEVRGLIPQGLRDGKTASRALGYQQVLAYLDGLCTEEEAFQATVTGTRRFVRRQRSWFRRDPAIVWLDGAREDLVEQALSVIKEDAQ